VAAGAGTCQDVAVVVIAAVGKAEAGKAEVVVVV